MDYWVKIFPVLWDGFTVSLSVYVLTLMFAMPLGMGIGLLADLVPSLRKPITVFTWLFRGTPLLLQLYLTMYGIPLLFPIRMDRFVAGTVTFIVNYAAYYTEIFRSGLAIIPVGQWQAGTVLGLKKWQTVWYVILPTMFRNTLLPLINEAITLVKDTSLLAAIAIGEMLRAAREIVSLDLRVDAYVMAGIFYLAFSLIVVWIGKRFEKKLLVQR